MKEYLIVMLIVWIMSIADRTNKEDSPGILIAIALSIWTAYLLFY